MKENNYTDLDKLFRQRLGGEDRFGPEFEPSETVWQGARKALDKDKGNRMAWIILGLISLLLISSAVYIRTLQNKIENLQSELALTEERAQNNLVLADDLKVYDRKEEFESVSVAKSPVQLQSKRYNVSERESDDLPLISEQTPSVASLLEKENDVKPGSFASLKGLDSEEELRGSAESQEVMGGPEIIHELESLKTAGSKVEFATDHSLILPTIIDDFGSKKAYKDIPAEIYFISSSNFTSFNMTNIPSSSASLTKYDMRYAGYSIGLGYSKPIKGNFSLDTRVTYHNIRNSSLFEEDLLYDVNQESRDVNGKRMYRSDVSILSPMSELERSITVNVDQFDIDNNDVYVNETSIDGALSMASLSLLGRWDILYSRPLSLFAAAGLSVNYLISMEEKMEVKLSYESKPMMTENINRDPSNDLRRWSVSGVIEGGVSYKVNDKLDADLSVGWNRSLTPINIPEIGNGANTYFDGISIGARIKIKL